MNRLKPLVRADGQDTLWSDVARMELAREDEAKIVALPAKDQFAARETLLRDRIRSRFYRLVFLEYLSADECDVDRECRGEPNVLTWLLSMAETPHLFPFLQGQSEGQKRFRIARLSEKIVQLHEIYARIGQARGRDRLRDKLEGMNSRECLAYLNQVHFPMLPSGRDLTLAAMLCPLRSFITFVQERVGNSDFVLPPDPKPRPSSINNA